MRANALLLASIFLAGCGSTKTGPPPATPPTWTMPAPSGFSPQIQQLVDEAESLRAQGRIQDSLRLFEMAAQQAPGDAGILHRIADSYYLLQRYHECLATLLRALAVQENANTRTKLGWAYFYTGNYPEAVRQLRRSIELDSTDWAPYDALAATCYRLGWYEEVLRAADMGRQRVGNQPRQDYDFDLWLNVVDLVHGRFAEAAARLGPGNRFSGITHRLRSEGLLCWEVYKGGPADFSGLKNGDILTTLGGRSLNSFDELTRVLNSSSSPSLPVVLLRAGQTVETTLLVGVTPDLPVRAAQLKALAASPAAAARSAKSLSVVRLELKPASVAPGGSFDLELDYLAADPAKAGGVLLEFSYSVLASGNPVFTGPTAALEAPNGRPGTRVEHLTAARQAGSYTVEVTLRSGPTAVKESVVLNIR